VQYEPAQHKPDSMIRVLEIALFLAPFVAFAAWRLFAPNTEIGPRHIVAAAIALLICFGLLAWLRLEEAEPAGSTYVPARLEDRRVQPPTAVP
jgi:hypothetical protein